MWSGPSAFSAKILSDWIHYKYSDNKKSKKNFKKLGFSFMKGKKRKNGKFLDKLNQKEE